MLVLDHWSIEPKRNGINLRIVGDEAILAQTPSTGAIEGSYFGYTFASILKTSGVLRSCRPGHADGSLSEYRDARAAEFH